jgi:Ca2+-binding EF-hand superfamily protein
MRRALLLAIFAGACACLAAADDPFPPTPPRDVQDLVFLGESRPVLIRLHVLIDGKPFREAWDEYMQAVFQFVDYDGDGVLNEKEVQRVPKPDFLLQLFRGMSFTPAKTARQSPELNLTLVPGKVTPGGLADYYHLSGVEPFFAFLQDRSSRAEALTDGLFRELDANKDQKLTKEEAMAAPAVLRKYDLNDDELLSVDELVPTADSNGMPDPAQRDQMKLLAESSDFLVLSPDDAPSRFAFALLSKYDKDQDEKLSRTEFAIDKETFDKLDADQDGYLDGQELAKFLKLQKVNLELTIRLGRLGEGEARLPKPGGLDAAIAHSRALDNGGLEFGVGETQVDVHAAELSAESLQAARQFIAKQFKATDIAQRGFIDPVQAEQNPVLKVFYPAADRNADEKLTLDELNAYLDLLGNGVARTTVLLVSDDGRNLFALLNTYHDGRLRTRELTQAWTRLSPFVKDGVLSRTELPRQFQLLLSQGQPGEAFNAFGGTPVPGTSNRTNATVAGKGPLWFQKMDRNGDGFVSRREFLGSKEDFDRIDTDGDGLISPDEAARADAQLRKPTQKDR